MLHSRRPGGAYLGLILLLLALGSCWGGGQGTYTALRYRSPLRLSMEDYLRSQPKAAWSRCPMAQGR